MRYFLDRKFWHAVFALVGTTIGAGIFGLPYVFAQTGFFLGLIELVALTFVVILIQQILGEIALRTRNHQRLLGYDKTYLSPVWRPFSSLAVIFGTSGALLIYLILSGKFLSSIFEVNSFLRSLVFFAFWFFAIRVRPKTFGRFEFYLGTAAIFLIMVLALFNLKHININNFLDINTKNFFLPYGVILFAMLGYSVIPEMEEILGDRKHKLKNAILLGTIIPALTYILFAFVVVGVSGSLTSKDAVSGMALVQNSPLILILGSILGLFTVTSASLSLGVFLRETFNYDFNLNRWLSWALTGLVPLSLFLLGARDFIWAMGLLGGLIFGFRVIDILFIHQRSKKSGQTQPAYEINLSKTAYCFIGFLAIFGALLELWYSVWR